MLFIFIQVYNKFMQTKFQLFFSQLTLNRNYYHNKWK